jgi:hypothetical protein
MVDNSAFFSTTPKYVSTPFYIFGFSKKLFGRLSFWKYQEFINSTNLADDFVYMWKKSVDNMCSSTYFFFEEAGRVPRPLRFMLEYTDFARGMRAAAADEVF